MKEAAFDDTLDIHDWDAQNPAEISGMGRAEDHWGDKTPGYTKNMGNDFLPSVYYEDPDKKKARLLKNIKSFKDFIDK